MTTPHEVIDSALVSLEQAIGVISTSGQQQQTGFDDQVLEIERWRGKKRYGHIFVNRELPQAFRAEPSCGTHKIGIALSPEPVDRRSCLTSTMNTNATKPTTTWPELAEGLYGFLTGRGATIEYAFENMEITVPSSTAADAPAAKWRLNGALRVRTTENT